MTSKVFLFDNDQWLYCSDVTFEDGVYHGWVENGAWHLMYDTELEGWFACHSREAADSLVAVTKGRKKLVWACDPSDTLFDYNDVIENAKQRYKANEPAVFEIGIDKNFALYQKLKPKYENDGEYDLYLELRKKYEDDDVIPF